MMILVGVKQIRLSTGDGNVHTIFISKKELDDIDPRIFEKLKDLVNNSSSDKWDLDER